MKNKRREKRNVRNRREDLGNDEQSTKEEKAEWVNSVQRAVDRFYHLILLLHPFVHVLLLYFLFLQQDLMASISYLFLSFFPSVRLGYFSFSLSPCLEFGRMVSQLRIISPTVVDDTKGRLSRTDVATVLCSKDS